MKNVKRMLTLALVVLMMAALLTGCTGNTTTTTSSAPSAAASSAAPKASASAAPAASSAAPAASSAAPKASGAPAAPALSGIGSVVGGAGNVGGGKDIYKDKINIAYIPISTAGQVNQVIDLVLKDVVTIYPNVKITSFDPQFDPNKQNSMLNEAVTDKYDAIIALCMDPAASADAVTQAEKAGIPVITIDCNTNAVHSFHLQGTDYGSGLVAAQIVSKALNNKGNYIVIDAPAEQKEVGRMGTAFIDYCKANTQMKLLVDQSIAMWSQENARTAMADLLTKYPKGEIQAIYCASDDLAGGVLQALQAAGRDKEGIVIYGNCGYLPILQAIKSGQVYGTNFTDTYARYYMAFHMALYYINTGATSAKLGFKATPVIYDTLLPVNKDNVDYYISVSRFPFVMGQK